ncbi:hypothetical protein LshimejAT787_0604540 [Lyophyllum shimeji]|uniref:Uncharacterized protein n=1 Tax=Lyophyllum shimeji TaxID=47721 RepID=A0A9P3PMW3_LYOSH|nr:hypothetical protein LshimejAT787_0604540 [Lyophyllum shimeji]
MLSSPPLTPARSVPAPTTSKRHSLNVSAGPRPLHLLDRNVPSPSVGPATAPLAPGSHSPGYDLDSSPSTSRISAVPKPNPRRQSSISYRTSTRDVELLAQSPRRSSSHGLTRSLSMGPESTGPLTSPGNRRSAGYEGNTPQERPPLTLVEQHSDLLRSIAQKESKCLELRSQLVMHEAELSQLKQKWERIVNQSFSNSTSLPPSSQGNGVVLEGIREGVQGVGRFIAAGLAIGELSPASTSTLSQLPRSVPPPLRLTHATSQSSSSASTSATTSTRFSQSSTSSIGEETVSLYEKTEEEGSAQILMVHDTGATPTVSPNPAFEHQRQQRELRTDTFSQSTRSNVEGAKDTFATSSKVHRRRSRDTHPFENMLSHEATSSKRSSSPSKATKEDKKQGARLKQASINGTEFPPVSSIPGLASLTVGVASPPVASWVGSVGKKWEELQRGSTFSKNQKRASVLLADVSQSIVSALSPPPSTSTSKSASPVPPLYFSPSPASPLTASTSSTSLLDEADFNMPATSIMTPDPTPSPHSDHTLQPLQSISSAATKAKLHARSKPVDEEDEWNCLGDASFHVLENFRSHESESGLNDHLNEPKSS